MGQIIKHALFVMVRAKWIVKTVKVQATSMKLPVVMLAGELASLTVYSRGVEKVISQSYNESYKS